MREILFKGAQKVDGSKSLIWYEGSLIIETDGYTGEREYYIQNENGSYLVIPETVGQYTGLTDKNGKKIFEGDIVKHHFGEEKGIVRFGEYRQPFNDDIHTKHIGFYVDWISGKEKELLRKDLGYWVNLDKNYDYEIFIGNIHDNPELLKEADNE